MGYVVYLSKVHIERLDGSVRRATLPGESQPLLFGYHDGLGRHFGIDAANAGSHASTLDHLVAAVGGCLTGTFGSGLEARGITLGPGDLEAEVLGEVERDASEALVIKRIRVRYLLSAPPHRRDVVARVLAIHADACPVARTLKGCVAIGTSVEYR